MFISRRPDGRATGKAGFFLIRSTEASALCIHGSISSNKAGITFLEGFATL
jgi:hypothetical protein